VKVEWTCKGTIVLPETDRGVDVAFNGIMALARQLLTEFDALL
jgi:hypothetical protein